MGRLRPYPKTLDWAGKALAYYEKLQLTAVKSFTTLATDPISIYSFVERMACCTKFLKLASANCVDEV
jgi:hypothetical protein